MSQGSRGLDSVRPGGSPAQLLGYAFAHAGPGDCAYGLLRFLARRAGKTIAVSGDTRLPRHARDLVERGWTQRADARADDDTVVHPCDARAVSWSLLGALVVAVENVAAEEGEHAAIGQLARTCILLGDILDTDSLEEWNDADDRRHTDVIVALERVIAEAPRLPHGFRGSSPN